MSIINATYGPVFDLFGGEQNTDTQKLPIGIWKATGSTVGDGTAGYIRFNIVPPTSSRNKYLWSFEEFSVLKPNNATNSIVTVFSVGEVINGISSIYYRSHDAAGAAAWGSNTLYGNGPHPLFARIANPDLNVVPSFSIIINENTNLAGYGFEAWGYLWGAGCRRTAGGPSRPM